MTRRCASRDCLVRIGTNPPAGDSRLRGSGQTGGSRTARSADCRDGRNSTKPSLSRPGWGRSWNPRARHRKNSVHCLVPRAGGARYYWNNLAWEAKQGLLHAIICFEIMNNPWIELPETPPYILRQYRESTSWRIDAFNGNSIPEPFIGNPATASLILLNLNPSDDPQDPATHRTRSFARH